MELSAVERLEELFRVSPDFIIFLVIVVCVLLFGFSFKSERLRDISPALMVSAGIIGTFWGTFIALSGFETGVDTNGVLNYKVVVDNIPLVLKGMTSAFLTSLFGLLSAFMSKILFRFLPRSAPQILPAEKDTLELLKEIKDGIVGESDKSLSSQMSILQAEYRDSANDLKQSIAGNGESSVTSQLVKLRNENNAGFKMLDGRLDGLADAIRISLVENLQNLTQELKTVIGEQLVQQLQQTNAILHTQLSEMLERIEEALINQFGETFKQFNAATQAIKKWQEDHREQVEQLTEAFKMTATGIEQIRANCESIPATMQALQTLTGALDQRLQTLQTLMGELDERLQAFAEMKQQAEASFPAIKANLDTIGADLQASAAGFSGLESVIAETHKQVAEASKNMIEEVRNSSDSHQEAIRKIVDNVEQASEECVTTTQEKLTTMAQDNAQATSDALTAIVEAWGSNILGIAEKLKATVNSINDRNRQ